MDFLQQRFSTSNDPICCTTDRGTQRGSLRKRPENNNKVCLMLSEAILSILGDCWENLICSTLPARLMGEFPASKVHLHLATWLTGKLPSWSLSSHYWPVWVWAEGGTFQWGEGGEGREGGLLTNNTFQLFYNSTHFSPATLSFQGHYFVQISQPAKIGLEEQIFLRNRWLVAPGQSWFIGSKAWNIAIQLVLQPCC